MERSSGSSVSVRHLLPADFGRRSSQFDFNAGRISAPCPLCKQSDPLWVCPSSKWPLASKWTPADQLFPWPLLSPWNLRLVNLHTQPQQQPLRLSVFYCFHLMHAEVLSKLGGAGDRFGDRLCVDCANLPSVNGRNWLQNAKFTRPITKITKLCFEATGIFLSRRL